MVNDDKKESTIPVVSNPSLTENDNKIKKISNVELDAPRRSEHRCLTALSGYAENTNSLEITRPSVTNCPDGGHDINVVGEKEEVKELLSIVTGTPVEELGFLNKSAKNGKLKVRIDVKNGATISGDTIDAHAANSNRSPDCQANLLMLTNPDVEITPSARKRLNKNKTLFCNIGALIDIAPLDGLKKIEEKNKCIFLDGEDKNQNK